MTEAEIGSGYAFAGPVVELGALLADGTPSPEARVRIPLAMITEFGPTLLSKVLDLNDTQESSLTLVFHYADTAGLPLLDLKDLRAVLQFLTGDEGKDELRGLGGLSKQTVGVILRKLVAF